MNMITVFLNSQIKNSLVIYIEQSSEYKLSEKVCLLWKTLYNLKQSPYQWYQMLYDYLVNNSMRWLDSDHSVFIERQLIVAVYVDDLLIDSKDMNLINSFKESLSCQFKMTDISSVCQYLSMKVIQNQVNKTLCLSQTVYTKKMLIKFSMQDCHVILTSMKCSSSSLIKGIESSDNDIIDWYTSAIESLIWLMMTMRPDISYLIIFFSQFITNSTLDHVSEVKRIFCYLTDTADLDITYGLKQLDHADDYSLVEYVDSNWSGCNSIFRSTTGYVFFFNGGIISHTSKCQLTVTLSSTEAEYNALLIAMKKAVWLRQLLLELDRYKHSITLNTDSEGSLALAKNPEFHACTKHINIKVH